MERVDVSYARDHLPELIERVARGEEVSIFDPRHGSFELRPTGEAHRETQPDIGPPILGQWQGRLIVPARLFEPLSEEELGWLSGERSE